MISSERKQQIVLGLAIFLALNAISYSFNGWQNQWLWEKRPLIALGLLLLAFLFIRIWLQLELGKQKERILQAIQGQNQPQLEDFTRQLSPRELEVIALIRTGKSNQQIADELFIALSTVKTHINNIYKILEVTNRREALDKLKR